MMFSKMNCASVAASQFLTALASTHLVRYYVPVMMYLAPVRFPGGLIGPMKSIADLSNAHSVIYGRSGIHLSLKVFLPYGRYRSICKTP